MAKTRTIQELKKSDLEQLRGDPEDANSEIENNELQIKELYFNYRKFAGMQGFYTKQLKKLEDLGQEKSRLYQKYNRQRKDTVRQKNFFRAVMNEKQNNINAMSGQDFKVNVDGYYNFNIKYSKLQEQKNPALYILEKNLRQVNRDLRKPGGTDNENLEVIRQKYQINIESIKTGKSVSEILQEASEDELGKYQELRDYLDEKGLQEYPIFFENDGADLRLT